MKTLPGPTKATLSAHMEMYTLRFREYLGSSGMSERTVKDYPLGIRPFLAFVEELGVCGMVDVEVRHILSYQRLITAHSYRGKPLSARTHNTRMGMLRCFFRYLHKTGQIVSDPMANLELPKRGHRLPRQVLEEAEVMRILESVPTGTPLGLRDKAMVELLYGTGLRVGELCALDLKHLHLDKAMVTVIGKGNREAVIPFPKEAAAAMGNYLLYGRPRLVNSYLGGPRRKKKDNGPRDALFLTKNGQPFAGTGVYFLLQRLVKRAGINKKIGPHTLRHSVATHLLQRGADIRHIQVLLRHKDISTTQIYTHLCVDDLREAQEMYHPRSRPRAK